MQLESVHRNESMRALLAGSECAPAMASHDEHDQRLDVWDRDLRVLCDGTGLEIVSAGPDGVFETPDDQRHPEAGRYGQKP